MYIVINNTRNIIMRSKSNNKNINKTMLCNKEEADLLERVAKQFDTYEADIMREALKDFYTKHGIIKE
jgi:hypothetical protein